MIGETVTHPQYGQGTVTAQFRNGNEWMVRFQSGLRFRRPRVEFEGQADASNGAGSALHPNSLHATTQQNNNFTPMTKTQFDARQLVEALRVGVAPAQHVQDLTIGLDDERKVLEEGFSQAHSRGGAGFAVIGDYGHGKSHIVELTAQEALKRDFLVATVSLDLQEMPPHRSFDIYAGLMHSLRYPDTDERGLGPLLEKATSRESIREQLNNATDVELDPLNITIAALNNTSSIRAQRAWYEWLMGGQRTKTVNKTKPRGLKFPSIYKQGHNARQIAYLLSGVSVLSRLMGYSGLAVLIDEAESYSLLYAYQKPKASQFFSALLYTAMQENQKHLDADLFPQHRYRQYPMAYNEKQSLFFLFTVTRDDNQMPLEEWLNEEQIFTLEPYHTAQELGHFMEKAMVYHAQAYGYEVGERQRQIRRGAAEHMALGMKNHNLSIRGAVRLTIELFDLLYLHPEYETATLLDELRSTLRA